jgi:hypothetical protein
MTSVYEALERWVVTCLRGLCQALRIHAVRRKECSFGLMIRDRLYSSTCPIVPLVANFNPGPNVSPLSVLVLIIGSSAV